MQAIVYARKFLAPWGATHMKELQRATATLVFISSTNCAPYKVSSIVYVLSVFVMSLHHKSGSNWVRFLYLSMDLGIYIQIWDQLLVEHWSCGQLLTCIAPRLSMRWPRRTITRSHAPRQETFEFSDLVKAYIL